jgi:hypothetical protein
VGDIALNLDPKAFGTDAYGDLLWVDGGLVLTSDSDARGTNVVLQRVHTRLRLFLGEFFMDTSAGVPWLQHYLLKNPDASLIDAGIQDTILGTPGIAVLTAYSASANYAKRAYTVRFAATTQSGIALSSTVEVSA